MSKPREELEARVRKRTAELTRANEALRQDAGRLSAIIATQHDIATAGHNFIDVMTLIAERTQKLTRAAGAAIELIERDELVYRIGTGAASRHVGLRLAIASSLSGECMRLNEVLRCDDKERDPRVNREACRKIGLRSMVVVPLYHNGGPVGVLKVLSTKPNVFSERDARALQLMAGLIGAAMSNAAEFESRQELLAERTSAVTALETRARQQNAIAQLSQHALEGCGLAALLEDAVAQIPRILEVEYCSVLELRPDGKALFLRAGAGWKEGCVGHAKLVAGRESPAGFTLSSSSSVIIEDLRTETRCRRPRFLLDHGVVSAVSVIIHGRSKPYGVLGAYTIKRRKFTNDDVHFLQSIANVLAAVIDRRQLEEELLAISGREEQRIGQDLHDGVCQQLAGIEFRNSVLVQQLAKDQEAKAEAILIGELIRDANRQARFLAKGLSPVQLDANGLMSALEESKFKVVIIYEDGSTGRRAKHFYDKLIRELEDECAFCLQLWSFQILAIPELRESAVESAAQADFVILSLHGKAGLPVDIREWIENLVQVDYRSRSRTDCTRRQIYDDGWHERFCTGLSEKCSQKNRD